MLPIAAFLAGALLSLLLPVGLLIALTVWYVMLVRRIPEPTQGDVPPLPGPAGSRADPALPPAEGP